MPSVAVKYHVAASVFLRTHTGVQAAQGVGCRSLRQSAPAGQRQHHIAHPGNAAFNGGALRPGTQVKPDTPLCRFGVGRFCGMLALGQQSGQPARVVPPQCVQGVGSHTAAPQVRTHGKIVDQCAGNARRNDL